MDSERYGFLSMTQEELEITRTLVLAELKRLDPCSEDENERKCVDTLVVLANRLIIANKEVEARKLTAANTKVSQFHL